MSSIYSILPQDYYHEFAKVDNKKGVKSNSFLAEFFSFYRKINKETASFPHRLENAICDIIQKVRSFLIYFPI